MQTTLPGPVLTILTPLTLAATALAPASDSPRWAPPPGTELAKSFVTRSSLELQSMVLRAGGAEQDRSGIEVAVDSEHGVSITDRYSGDDGGRPARIEREFRAVEKSLDARVAANEETEFEATGQHALTGHEVVFVREDDEWEAAFAEDDDGDQAWLDGLTAEADLADLLPEEAVEQGESWEIAPDRLLALLRPAGAPTAWPVDITGETDEEGRILCPVFCLRAVAGEIEGEVVAKWTETRSEGDRRLAVVELAIEVSLTRDLTASLDTLRDVMDAAGELPPFDAALAEGEWKAEGTLTWDLDTHLPDGLALEGPLSLTLVLDAEDGGEALQVEIELGGHAEAELTTTRE